MPSMAPFWTSTASEFGLDFEADPDPEQAFLLWSADQDTAIQKMA
jgi:hypothetical protein